MLMAVTGALYSHTDSPISSQSFTTPAHGHIGCFSSVLLIDIGCRHLSLPNSYGPAQQGKVEPGRSKVKVTPDPPAMFIVSADVLPIRRYTACEVKGRLGQQSAASGSSLSGPGWMTSSSAVIAMH